MDKWQHLIDRLERYTDFTPEQIEMIRKQVLIALEDSHMWPDLLYDVLEKKEDIAREEGVAI